MSNNYQLKDSGDRRDFGTGAVRDMGEGKGRTDLLPFFALLELSKHFEAGAAKYAEENWRKGIPLRVYLDSAIRHLFKFGLGMRDERHDLAALWNVACLIETQHMIDRGLLPADLANLPNWYDADDAGDAYAQMAADDADTLADSLTADDIAGMPLAGAMPGAYGCDDTPAVGEDVTALDNWLDTRFPLDPNGPETRADLERVNVTVRQQVSASDYPLDLRPQDREYRFVDEYAGPGQAYTRGHAEDTAARFNAGRSYADLARLVADNVDLDATPHADHTTPTEDSTMSFIGTADNLRLDELPSDNDILNALLADAAEAIGDHPLFHVSIIDGPDAKDYDGPEVGCALDGDCGCVAAPEEPDPLAGKAYVIVGVANRGTPREGDERQWFVKQDGSVFYSAGPGEPCRPSKVRTREGIRNAILAGNLYVAEAGVLPLD